MADSSHFDCPSWIAALFTEAAKVPLAGVADPFRNRIRRLSR